MTFYFASARSRAARGWCNRPQVSHINPPNIGAEQNSHGGRRPVNILRWDARPDEMLRCRLAGPATGCCARATCGAISRPMRAGMLMLVTNQGGDAETNEMRARHVSIQDSPVLELEQKQLTSGAVSLPYRLTSSLGLISLSLVINVNKP